jgi:hypothetical protein
MKRESRDQRRGFFVVVQILVGHKNGDFVRRSLRLAFFSAGRAQECARHTSGYAIWVAIFRTASDSISRVIPLMIMLMPTSVPIAHTELEGQCT